MSLILLKMWESVKYFQKVMIFDFFLFFFHKIVKDFKMKKEIKKFS